MADLNFNHVENILLNWIRNKVKNAGCTGAVVGLSGGIDSAVTAVLCQKACPDNFLGVILPCYSNKQDAADAELLAETYKMHYRKKDLRPTYDQLLATLEGEEEMVNQENIAVVNIKPRLRMVALYYYASQNNALVVGTDNWSELKVGYFTKYGDGGVDLAPLGRLVKTEVRELARHLGIPEKIINKKPSAGLWKGQTDEEEMGFTYQQLDNYILTGEVDELVKERIEKLVEKNSHKTEPIPKPSRRHLL